MAMNVPASEDSSSIESIPSIDEPTESLPNMVTHFEPLVTGAQRRTPFTADTNDEIYDEFMAGAKREIIDQLKATYKEIGGYCGFCRRPSVKTLLVEQTNQRLRSRKLEIMKDLCAFVKELGFACTSVRAVDLLTSRLFLLDLSLAPTMTDLALEALSAGWQGLARGLAHVGKELDVVATAWVARWPLGGKPAEEHAPRGPADHPPMKQSG